MHCGMDVGEPGSWCVNIRSDVIWMVREFGGDVFKKNSFCSEVRCTVSPEYVWILKMSEFQLRVHINKYILLIYFYFMI